MADEIITGTDDFDFMLNADLPDDASGESTPTAVEGVVLPTPPATTPQGPPAVPSAVPIAVEGQPPVAPLTPPAPPVAPAPVVQPPVAAAPVPAPPAPVAEIPPETKWAELRTKATQEVYDKLQLAPEEAANFLPEQVDTLKKIAAQVQVGAFETAFHAIMNNLPAAMEYYGSLQRSQQAVVEKFHTQWPELKGHEATVTPIAQALRQLNPNVSQDQLNTLVGAAAMTALGLTRGSTPAASQPPQPVVQPFRPAAPGAAAPGGGAGAAEEDVFADLVASYGR